MGIIAAKQAAEVGAVLSALHKTGVEEGFWVSLIDTATYARITLTNIPSRFPETSAAGYFDDRIHEMESVSTSGEGVRRVRYMQLERPSLLEALKAVVAFYLAADPANQSVPHLEAVR